MSRVSDNEEIIMKRANDICEICQQMGWRKCESHPLNYNCDQLINKFVDHDGRYVTKCEHHESGNKTWYYTIAGVKVPAQVVNHYCDFLLDRQAELGIASWHLEKEMYTGRLEEVRATLHMAILQSIGWQMMDMNLAARIFVRVLEKFVEKRAKYTTFKTGRLKDFPVDQYNRDLERLPNMRRFDE